MILQKLRGMCNIQNSNHNSSVRINEDNEDLKINAIHFIQINCSKHRVKIKFDIDIRNQSNTSAGTVIQKKK